MRQIRPLTDFAADQRAATPTAAAELATPVLNDIHLHLGINWSFANNDAQPIEHS